MSNPSKAKGTRFETSVCLYLRDVLDDDRIERRALHGTHDMGDIYGIRAHGNSVIVEAKAHSNVTRSLVSEWRRQTIDERENADADAALLVVKVPRHSTAEATVHVTLCDLARIAMFVSVSPTFYDRADDSWVTMTLAEAASLIRGA